MLLWVSGVAAASLSTAVNRLGERTMWGRIRNQQPYSHRGCVDMRWLYAQRQRESRKIREAQERFGGKKPLRFGSFVKRPSRSCCFDFISGDFVTDNPAIRRSKLHLIAVLNVVFG